MWTFVKDLENFYQKQTRRLWTNEGGDFVVTSFTLETDCGWKINETMAFLCDSEGNSLSHRDLAYIPGSEDHGGCVNEIEGRILKEVKEKVACKLSFL